MTALLQPDTQNSPGPTPSKASKAEWDPGRPPPGGRSTRCVGRARWGQGLAPHQLVTSLPAPVGLVETTWKSRCPPAPPRVSAKAEWEPVHPRPPGGDKGCPSLTHPGVSEEASCTEASSKTQSLRISHKTVQVSIETHSS